MNPDFVFFDGQLWPYDEWAKIAPLSFFNDKPLNIIKWFDPSGFVFVDNRSMREIDEDERHFGY